METLGYNKNRLLLGAAASFFVGLVFLWLISDPQAAAGLRGPARLLGTTFGRFVVAPLFMLAAFACTWRFSVVALGHGKAIEADGPDLVVHTIWGPKRFRPGEIRSAELQRVAGQTHLIVRAAGGLFGAKKAGLVLGLTELAPARVPDLMASIERLRAGRVRSAPAAAAAREVSEFDADEALARYLARKEATGASADPAAGIPGGARPMFGRKRV
jgi:hypothetical protein